MQESKTNKNARGDSPIFRDNERGYNNMNPYADRFQKLLFCWIAVKIPHKSKTAPDIRGGQILFGLA